MRRLAILVLLVGGLALAPLAHADTSSVGLAYSEFNADSTDTVGYTGAGFTNTLDANGEGTITFTDTAVGSTYFNAFLDYELGIPFFDENGMSSGSPAAGQSWEIGDGYASSIYTDFTGSALTSTNQFTACGSGGCKDNYAGTTNGTSGSYDPTYNGDVALAMGFTYTALTAGEEEVITLTASETAPASGFYLEQFTSYGCNDVVTSGSGDTCGGDVVATELYLTGSAVEEAIGGSGPPPPPPGVPEPGTLPLLGAGLLFVVLAGIKRFGFRQGSLAA